MEDRAIEKLIKEIAPLNNVYRMLVRRERSGTKILEIMWEVGDILKKFRVKNVHPIAWQIYGKSPGIRKSNITRDFLSYCFRIRNYFESKNQIVGEFPQLKRYSLFREALPLLENPRFRLEDREIKKLKALLNSAEDPSKIKKYLVKFKKERIGIVNPRTQRLREFKKESERFLRLHNYLKEIILKENTEKLEHLQQTIKAESAPKLSRLLVSLTQEGLNCPYLKLPKGILGDWAALWEDLANLHVKGRIEDRNRFRRLVPPGYLMNMAEMINAVHDNLELKRMKDRLERVHL